MNEHFSLKGAKRGKTKPLPLANGAIVRAEANCDRCGIDCMVGGNLIKADAYYKYNEEKLCTSCIRTLRVL